MWNAVPFGQSMPDASIAGRRTLRRSAEYSIGVPILLGNTGSPASVYALA
jgi:hypothetical protein